MLASEETKQSANVKIKRIIVSQPKPDKPNSPYFDLEKTHHIKFDFRPFIHIEGVPATDFRKAKISIADYDAVIFTSLNAVVNFFRICEEMRVKLSQDTKYFCMSETIALYLQKYIEYRKRKVFFGNGALTDLTDLIKKHKEYNFLFPCSDIHKKDIPEFLAEQNIPFKEAVIYRTVCSDLSDLDKLNYDMIVFFSPSGIRSLFQNFPDFEQGKIKIAAFGSATAKAVSKADLRLDIEAPVPDAPSMTMAIDKYLRKVNG